MARTHESQVIICFRIAEVKPPECRNSRALNDIRDRPVPLDNQCQPGSASV